MRYSSCAQERSQFKQYNSKKNIFFQNNLLNSSMLPNCTTAIVLEAPLLVYVTTQLFWHHHLIVIYHSYKPSLTITQNALNALRFQYINSLRMLLHYNASSIFAQAGVVGYFAVMRKSRRRHYSRCCVLALISNWKHLLICPMLRCFVTSSRFWWYDKATGFSDFIFVIFVLVVYVSNNSLLLISFSITYLQVVPIVLCSHKGFIITILTITS